jgi:hypothetical protein
MADFNTEPGATRDDLLQRVALMETMIAQGRCSTQRYGWVFVAWGVCYIAASLWAGMGPHPVLAWPVCLTITILGVNFGLWRQGRTAAVSSMSRTLGAVWMAFGVGIMLFVGAVAASHHFDDVMFISVICFLLGTVNVTSAAIYRWKMQGLAGGIWWAAAVIALFVGQEAAGIAFLVATFLSQIVFGLYLMVLESRRASHHTQRAIA